MVSSLGISGANKETSRNNSKSRITAKLQSPRVSGAAPMQLETKKLFKLRAVSGSVLDGARSLRTPSVSIESSFTVLVVVDPSEHIH